MEIKIPDIKNYYTSVVSRYYIIIWYNKLMTNFYVRKFIFLVTDKIMMT